MTDHRIFRLGQTVLCRDDNWQDELMDALGHKRLPQKGEIFTVALVKPYRGTNPLVPHHLKAIWLKEIPGPPFDSMAFETVE